MDIRDYINKKIQVIDSALNRYLPSSNTRPGLIHRAMRYAVFPGGKRLRPIFTIAGFEACGGRGNKILPLACAIELIHTYTLIHDDLPCMDNDDYRRGRLSCHKKFGEAIAVLAGDALLTLGFQLVSEAGNIDIIKELSQAIGSKGTIGGQVEDVLCANKYKNQKDMDFIINRKTGELFRVAVKIGGMMSSAPKSKIDSLDRFGRYIGFMFQLLDDLVDNDGYVKVFGRELIKDKIVRLKRSASRELSVFGENARYLLGLVDVIIDRSF